MKKFYLFLIAIIALSAQSWAYDFSYTYQGQTLYYNIVNGNAEVTSQNGSYPTGSLTIPSSVTYNGTTYSVTSIGESAFYYCSGLTSVTIPNSVTSIDNYAFEECSGLTSVYYTGDVAGWCGITFGSETFGSEKANPLYYAHNLYINGSLVTDLVIPSGVTEIKDYAFKGATCLTSVTIPNSVTSIGESAFEDCSGLTSVTIPNSVTSIGDYAFFYCSGLTSVTIGNSVTSIGVQAFYGCSGLTEIYSHNHVAPYAAEYAFEDIPLSIPVYIPCGSMASYLSRWSYFSNFIEDEAFTFSAVSADNNMGAVQILTMPTCTNPQAVIYASANSGYRFDHWSDGNTANPRVLTVTEDTELTGYFVPDGGTQGIDDLTSVDGMKVYARGNTIVIDFSGQQAAVSRQDIVVYDVMGRVIKQSADSGQQAAVEIPVTTAGVYMVKVGDQPSRKVLVRP